MRYYDFYRRPAADADRRALSLNAAYLFLLRQTAEKSINYWIFVFLVVYALIGNEAICFILKRRGVPYDGGWSKNPFYMFNVCASSPKVGAKLKLFSFSTTAVVLAFVLKWT